jgi:hypothetical protein
MGELKSGYGILVDNYDERIYLEDLGVNDRMLLKWMLNRITRYRMDLA